MIVYLLGLLDLLAGASFLLLKFDINFFPIFFASLLVIKGIAFIKNIVSVVDLICGLLFFYALYSGSFLIFMYLAVVWLIQKGVFSFFKLF